MTRTELRLLVDDAGPLWHDEARMVLDEADKADAVVAQAQALLNAEGTWDWANGEECISFEAVSVGLRLLATAVRALCPGWLPGVHPRNDDP